jgi:hypothetical protein
MSSPLPSGPTLNPEYNHLLVKWAESGHDATPECEECGENLTGKQVHDTSTNWLCTSCHDKATEGFEVNDASDEYFDYGDVQHGHFDSDREDFHSDG